MAHDTFIEYQNKGFWIQESFIEVLSSFISQTFTNNGLSNYNENLINLYNNFLSNKSGINAGMVNILFDNYIDNESNILTITNIFNQTKLSILAIGDQLSIESLNQFEDNKDDEYFKIQWFYPIETGSLVATLDLMIDLLNQTFPYTSIEIQYYGFPEVNSLAVTL